MSATLRVEPRPPSDGSLDPTWQILREANILLRERWNRRLDRYGLSFSEYVGLELSDRLPSKPSDVARYIGISAAGATDLLDRLETRKLIRRVPDSADRRAVLIRLTAAGKRLLEQCHAEKEAEIQFLDAAMTSREREALAEGVRALRRALRPTTGGD